MCGAGRLVTKSREKGASSRDALDWRSKGQETGACVKAPPFSEFFLGPFESVCEKKHQTK